MNPFSSSFLFFHPFFFLKMLILVTPGNGLNDQVHDIFVLEDSKVLVSSVTLFWRHSLMLFLGR